MGYAILHKQLCDNSPGCPAMAVCKINSQKNGGKPAIYIDTEGKIDINRDNCVGCASCIQRCGLFRIVSSLYKELEYQKEFDEDPRNGMRFSAERFGCDIIDKKEHQLKSLDEVNNYINESPKAGVNVLELIDKNYIMCPFQAIAVDDIFNKFTCLCSYKKIIIESSNLDMFEKIKDDFSVVHFPVVLLISNGKVIGQPISTEYRIENETERVSMERFLENSFLEVLKGEGFIK